MAQTETVKEGEPRTITLQKLIPAKDPIEITEDKIAGVPCNNIVRQPIQDMNFNMTQVASIEVSTLSEPQIKATLGGGDQIYMSNGSLYITKSGVSWQPWVSPEGKEASAAATSYYRHLREGLVVHKADIAPETGKIGFVAAGMILGSPKDQYFFKEYGDEGAIAIATTTYAPLPEAEEGDADPTVSNDNISDIANGIQTWEERVEDTRGRNHLWVLTQNENTLEIAKVEKNFGEPGEDIRSVRFMDDHAYIVTFK